MSAEPEGVICFSTGEDTVAFSGMCPFEDIPRFFLVKPMVRGGIPDGNIQQRHYLFRGSDSYFLRPLHIFDVYH